MKTLLLLFTVVSLLVSAAALCPSGCSCTDDSTCEYYCDGSSFRCQPSIPTGNTCSGHELHPRECGSGSYCDLSYGTCQFTKNDGDSCLYDYSCSSGYCDYGTGSCGYTDLPFRWQLYVLVPGLITTSIVTLFIVLLVRRRRRLTVMQSQSQSQSQSSFQNAGMVGQMPPPAYYGSVTHTQQVSHY